MTGAGLPGNGLLRPARREDIAGMHRVRLAVRENRLVRVAITEADYVEEIETSGRGWVIESEGRVVAFAAGNARTGNIWALFVEPESEGRGYGRRLHDEMLGWLAAQGPSRLWLTTAPGTRAERFYRRAGWTETGVTAGGEIRFERAAGPSRDA